MFRIFWKICTKKLGLFYARYQLSEYLEKNIFSIFFLRMLGECLPIILVSTTNCQQKIRNKIMQSIFGFDEKSPQNRNISTLKDSFPELVRYIAYIKSEIFADRTLHPTDNSLPDISPRLLPSTGNSPHGQFLPWQFPPWQFPPDIFSDCQFPL